MRTVLIVVVTVVVVLELLAIAAIVQTRSAMSRGGDVITMAADGIPVNVGGETRTYSKGTYVMTGAGLERLRWHWVLKYAYATVTLPLAVAALGIYLLRRTMGTRQSRTGESV
jgi:hypothetical protein